jgi:hypothetical protein
MGIRYLGIILPIDFFGYNNCLIFLEMLGKLNLAFVLLINTLFT